MVKYFCLFIHYCFFWNAPQNISATFVDYQGNNLTTVLNTTPLTETFNEYPGVGQIGTQ